MSRQKADSSSSELSAIRRKGRLFVISGPSGVGKGSVINLVLAQLPSIELSVSATTRARRPHEIDGTSYHFLTEADFKQRVNQHEFYEHASYNNRMYGTLRSTVESRTGAGVDLILEIDIQGARQVRKLAPTAVLIYMQPPGLAELEKRLRDRATETEETVRERLAIAQEEQKSIRTDYRGHYVITNDVLEQCAEVLKAIVVAERHRLTGQPEAPQGFE